MNAALILVAGICTLYEASFAQGMCLKDHCQMIDSKTGRVSVDASFNVNFYL